MGMYRKKPVVIEAARFTGSSSSEQRIVYWMIGGILREGGIQTRDMKNMTIETLEGVMVAYPGDYIIKGVRGEFYPCKPDIFAATYESTDA